MKRVQRKGGPGAVFRGKKGPHLYPSMTEEKRERGSREKKSREEAARDASQKLIKKGRLTTITKRGPPLH